MDPESVGADGQGADVLGQTATAETESSVEKLPADPLVVAERVGEQDDVAAGGLTHLRHRVDEADLGGEEGVGRGLDQLGRGQIAAHHGGGVAERQRIHLFQLGQGPRTLYAEHQPVRSQGVLDRETLAQELRIPRDLDAVTGRGQGADPFLEGGRRTHRDGRLADDQGRPIEQRTQGVDGAVQLGQVRATARQTRGTDRQEMDVGPVGDLGVVGGEPQPAVGGVLGQQRLQPDLVDGGATRGQRGDPIGVDIHTDDAVAELRHPRRMRGTQIAGADHTDPERHAGECATGCATSSAVEGDSTSRSTSQPALSRNTV